MSDFNFNEVVIDRVHRIHEYDLNGKRLWTMNQVKDFKLTLGGETVYAQDAQGLTSWHSTRARLQRRIGLML